MDVILSAVMRGVYTGNASACLQSDSEVRPVRACRLSRGHIGVVGVDRTSTEMDLDVVKPKPVLIEHGQRDGRITVPWETTLKRERHSEFCFLELPKKALRYAERSMYAAVDENVRFGVGERQMRQVNVCPRIGGELVAHVFGHVGQRDQPQSEMSIEDARMIQRSCGISEGSFTTTE